ncbi:hypothetical protein DER44DRAFT_812096 [Fusarium oxysporum]|nr:hypothetical protein DER44DRAFT_812096 [Fusarium oxysporum]
MAFFIKGKDCMFLLVVYYIFVCLRLYARLFRTREKLNWSDYLLILSAFSALSFIICNTLTYQMGVLDNYETSVKLSKMSMLAFYRTYSSHFAGKASSVQKALYRLTAFICLSYLVILLDNTFFCNKDISVQWSQKEGAYSVFYALKPFILNFTLDLTCYFTIYIFSIILLKQGLLQRSYSIAVTFVLSALTICSIIVRFITLNVGTGQENLVYPLSMLKMALAITIIALPGLKLLVG